MKLSLMDSLMVVGYLGLLVTLGVIFVCKKLDPEEFMLGQRDYKGGLLGVTFASKAFSSVGFWAILDIGFWGKSWSWVQLVVVSLIGYGLGWWCVRVIRESGKMTMFGCLGKCLGRWATMYGGVCYLIFTIMRLAVCVYVIMDVLALECSEPTLILCMLLGVVVCFYLYLGGIAGMLWTNVFNLLMWVIGIGVALVWVGYLLKMGGGENVAWQMDFSWVLDEQSGMHALLLFVWMMDVFAFGFSQSSAQLYLSAQSEKEAKRGLFIGMLLMGVMMFMLWLVGIGLREYVFRHQDMMVLLTQPSGNEFILLMEHLLPVGVKGLFLIAFVASGLSALTVDLSSMATLFYMDFYNTYWGQKWFSANKRMQVHKCACGIGAIVIMLAVVMHWLDPVNLLMLWKDFSIILMSGMLGLWALVRFSKTADGLGAMIGLFAGGFLWIVLAGIFEAFVLPVKGFGSLLMLPLSVGMIVCVGWLCSFIFSRKEQN